MAEFFNLAEIPLNSHNQAWGNLGYWREASEYSDACRALATLLGDASQLCTDSRVMDVGFGSGDQLLHWLGHYEVERLFGINLSHSQTDLAKARLVERGYREAADSIRRGDVSDPAFWEFVSGQGIDCILALDCAYHFPDRARFFLEAGKFLPAGGRIGVTDFVLAETFQPRSVWGTALRSMLRGSRIPPHNLVHLPRYLEQLEAAGFAGVHVRDISEWVLPAFRHWLRGFKREHRARMSRSRWLKYDITAAFLDWAYRKQILRYVVVTARR